jgi:hypothetical protein
MAVHEFSYQPTLKQLLQTEALAEAQIISGKEFLDRSIVQVVTALTPSPRPGSLLVIKPTTLGSQDSAALRELAGVVVIKPFVGTTENGPGSGGAAPMASVNMDVELGLLTKLCADAQAPLIVVPGYADPLQIAEDVRMAFLSELKRSSSRMHASFLTTALEQGAAGLIEELSALINRPIALESEDFKIVAAKNMGPTPPGQQRALSDEVSEAIKRLSRSHEGRTANLLTMAPLRLGRRLVMPVFLDNLVVGYFSVMLKPTDDHSVVAEYLQPAALAAMVDFRQRQKGATVFTVTQRSLLKDLLSGRALSAADQERLEQHFGFDLCDGLLVFAVQELSAGPSKGMTWPEDPYVSTEIEGTRVYVVPYHAKSEKTWQQEAEELVQSIKKNNKDRKIQLGAGRMIQTSLDLPDSYREARQALIIGSMIHGDSEFITGYGDLGVRRLLYLMIDHPELDRFYEENLAPLEAYDAEWESELVPTLRVYLKEGANLNSAARALFIHRHTLRYRLEQIAEILKVDIDSQEVLLNLQIAFLVKDMKGNTQV